VPNPDQSRRRGRKEAVPVAAAVPKKKHGPQPDPGRVLLAKIVSTLAGALLGLLAANLIGYFFISDFDRLIAQTQQDISNADQKLEEEQTSIESLQLEIKNLNQKIKEESSKTGALAQEHPDRERLSANYKRLEALLEPHNNRTLSRQAKVLELKEYQETIGDLNLLCIMVIGIFTLLGYFMYPLTLRYIERSVDTWIAVYAQAERRSQTLLIGFFAGLIIAVLVLLALFTTFSTGPLADAVFRLIFGTFFVVAMGTAGSLVAVNYFGPGPRRVDPYREFRALSKPKVLDTSVLIDGRVQEVAATGFLDGSLVVTNSVLRELQTLADSSDGRKRDKGRRGLELVRTMQDDPRLSVMVLDDAELHDGARPTDEQLIVVAQAMGAAVVTNDYNLNRVAAIRDVQVINLNALANAVKTRHLPGDMIEIHIADRGKQRGQGVGYLEDGTMVVVEDGEPFIRQTRWIKLTSVTQTVQGRLIFGRADLADEEGRDGA
jgi:uncharacterized protein YacL/cell division protein FtsL